MAKSTYSCSQDTTKRSVQRWEKISTKCLYSSFRRSFQTMSSVNGSLRTSSDLMKQTLTGLGTLIMRRTSMHTRFSRLQGSAGLTVIEKSSSSSARISSDQADGRGLNSLWVTNLIRTRSLTPSSSGHKWSCTKKISSHCLRLSRVSLSKPLSMSGTTWLMTKRIKLHVTIRLATSTTMSSTRSRQRRRAQLQHLLGSHHSRPTTCFPTSKMNLVICRKLSVHIVLHNSRSLDDRCGS